MILKLNKMAAVCLPILLLAALYYPVFRWLVISWNDSPYYAHAFMVPVIAGVIAWTKRHQLLYTSTSRSAGTAILAMGSVLYIMGFVYASYLVSAISLLVVLCGLVLYFTGRDGLRILAFPLGFLIFMVPMHPYLDNLSHHLQSLAASSSAAIITLLGVPVVRTGTELHLNGSTFVIGMPCSGINTLVALLTLAALYLYAIGGCFKTKIMLFILVFPIAVIANSARIASLLLIAHQWGPQTAMRFHDPFDVIFFVAALMCLLIVSKMVGCNIDIKGKTLPVAYA